MVSIYAERSAKESKNKMSFDKKVIASSLTQSLCFHANPPVSGFVDGDG